ncbi:hypothetical protein [Kitasatospora sp. NPDC057015]|uniref:hypothetical protein n=1 Tax=Kitasatospora sp. NPDC057015 TaxID=3346001 RepID=UPI0036428AD9
MPDTKPRPKTARSGAAPDPADADRAQPPTAVKQMLALTHWVGQGRQLTTTRQLRRADARHLVELLATGDQDTGTRSAAHLHGLQRLLAWAHRIDLLHTDGPRLRPGSAATRLGENPTALRKVLFATVPRLEDTRRGWHLVRPNLQGAADFSAGLVALWRRLRTGPLTEEDAAQVVWNELAGPYQLELRPPQGLATWKAMVAKDVTATLRLYEAVGAVRIEDGRVALTSYGLQRDLTVVRDNDFDPRKLGEAFIHEEVSSQVFHPGGDTTTELAPAVWTLAHRGYSGSGRLDIWTYTSRKRALKAGADLAMACAMDDHEAARSLYGAGRYEDLLALYESHHPETHLLRVQPSFLDTER